MWLIDKPQNKKPPHKYLLRPHQPHLKRNSQHPSQCWRCLHLQGQPPYSLRKKLRLRLLQKQCVPVL